MVSDQKTTALTIVPYLKWNVGKKNIFLIGCHFLGENRLLNFLSLSPNFRKKKLRQIEIYRWSKGAIMESNKKKSASTIVPYQKSNVGIFFFFFWSEVIFWSNQKFCRNVPLSTWQDLPERYICIFRIPSTLYYYTTELNFFTCGWWDQILE